MQRSVANSLFCVFAVHVFEIVLEEKKKNNSGAIALKNSVCEIRQAIVLTPN